MSGEPSKHPVIMGSNLEEEKQALALAIATDAWTKNGCTNVLTQQYMDIRTTFNEKFGQSWNLMHSDYLVTEFFDWHYIQIKVGDSFMVLYKRPKELS